MTLKGAKAVLVNITGGDDMTLLEVDEAANAISGQVDPEANIIFGAAFDPTLDGVVRVSVVATGMDGASIAAIDTLQPRHRDAPIVAKTIEAAAPAPVAADFEPAYAKTMVPEPTQPRPVEAEPALATVAQPDFGFEPAAKPAPVMQGRAAHRRSGRGRGGRRTAFRLAPLWRRASAEGRLSEPVRPASPRKSAAACGARRGAAAAAKRRFEPADDTDEEPREDLEIPSFLRRLAN